MNFAKYFLILTFGLCSTGWAQLRWDERSLELHPSPTDTKAVAEFHFTNTGPKPVTIKDVTTSCGCTTASLDKKVYALGEKGKITAVFDIGGYLGVQEKSVNVTTSDPKEPELVLKLKVFVPSLMELDSKWLNWQHGEELKPKVVNIKVSGDYPIHHLGIICTSPNIVTEVRHVDGSRDFQIIVTPKAANGEFAILDIKPDYPKEPEKSFLIYARADK